MKIGATFDEAIMVFTAIVPVYNEEARVACLIDSLVGHCDEIIVINKSSTDGTKRVIQEKYGSTVKVVDRPYTPKGVDDFSSYCSVAKNDWVFVCVASEVVPVQFWTRLYEFFRRGLDASKDLVMIPRSYYCFGVHVPGSPWDTSYFPFFFNKNRVLFSDKLHEHFSVSDEHRRHYLDCDRQEMILHLTHPNVDGFIASSLNYATIDCENSKIVDPETHLKTCINNILEAENRMSRTTGIDALMHFAAWSVYWNIYVLKICENSSSFDASEVYKSLQNWATHAEQPHRSSVGKKVRFLRRSPGLSAVMFLRFVYRGISRKSGSIRKLTKSIRAAL
ncbi:glycosyltransferase [Paucibacter sp. B2R-40]|uniref:glycosyltransferase n=1 Tax=Paucibacter sp. B2R-40 TaxID=2893554 RepID=UPI0021E39EB5|nr:glycosyltransferase [Paucibacter sp. B2R-40]MCV2354536.1 glycosyltransferase [Paucibacter sp. B2R-40]